MRRFIVVLFSVIPAFVFAQNKSIGTVVAAKPMSQIDSVMVRQIFMSALHEKIMENYTQAAELFSRVLQSDPGNAAALFELANLKKQKNNYVDAQPLLEKAVAISPDNEWYWLSLAECYEKNNNIVKLQNVFVQLIRINPDKPEYYYDNANALFIEKRYDDALKVYDQLQAMNGLDDDILAGKQKIYLIQGKVDPAAAQLQEMIADNPSQVKYYLVLAELYNSNNLQDKAFKVLKDAEKIAPNYGQIHLALADIYRDKKDNESFFNELELAFAAPEVDIDQKIKIILGYFPKFPDPNAKASALELSKILISAHPDDSKSYAMYGDMLFQTEKFKEAEAAYRKSIQLNGSHYAVYEQLVRIEISSNEMDQAIKDGENALALFPNQAWMNYLVGIACQQTKDYKKAIGYIKSAIDVAPDDKDLLSLSYSSLGDCYHEMKDFSNSDAAYDKSLTYNPDNAFALNNYAYYLSLRGEQLDKAAQMSAHSNELQPNTASFEDTYAWILFKQKKYADAKIWIEKAIVHDKTNSAVQIEHYGDIMFYLGDTNAAVQNWKKAKSFGEQSPVLDRKINERKYFE
ncbi:tetratricopeptide repeat protein [Mucilaginibacter sp. X5P1]|uniref:tetratricopeptide repeat protein n=1 Tax=Mucilaginibacter sp. X5P1 TaxID=2723088 RepID=UPI00160D64D8|nr:tetratricopeptide repeat protein [Mucilaginibacter sp. X5P1]MBB6138951.1 tetratricopeptide (TPR) repeat protein [Mucilaginibacter sp. X5P1]